MSNSESASNRNSPTMVSVASTSSANNTEGYDQYGNGNCGIYHLAGNSTNDSHSSSNQINRQEFEVAEAQMPDSGLALKNSKPTSVMEGRISKKTMGPVGGFSLITGVIIGSGIFISVKGSLQVFAPSIGALLLLWVFGGLISLIGGLCYVQLGIMVPKSGGERTYLCEAFGTQFAVVFTYGYCFLVKTLALAGIAQTFGKYFFEMVFGNYRDPNNVANLFAAIAILTLCLINSFSKNLANRTQIFFTVLKLLAIGTIIIIGVIIMALKRGYNEKNPFADPFKAEEVKIAYLASCLINIFWAYEGWNALGAVVGDMRNPKRDLPISMVLGTVVVVIVYGLTIVAYVGVLGYEAVSETETVAALFAQKTIPKASWIIPLFICISTYGACNGTVVFISRVVMTAAVNKEIPGFFGLVIASKRTPVIAIFVPAIISMIFLLLPFQMLITYCALISWTFYGLTMAACIKLYWRHSDLDRSFKLPTICPVIVLLVSLYIVIMCFVNNLMESCIITTVLLIIFGVHFLPERILRPFAMKRAHSKLKKLLTRYAGLVMADQHDIS